MPASLSAVARRFDFVRETDGPNAGAFVEFFQRFCDGVVGDSWCADFASVVEAIAYHGHTQSPRTGSCQTKLDYCRAQGWVVRGPAVDDLCFSVTATGHAHHVAIVTATAPLTTIAGNTSATGASSNGDGVYEHPVSADDKVFVRLPQ
jgi:hypothetical protein